MKGLIIAFGLVARTFANDLQTVDLYKDKKQVATSSKQVYCKKRFDIHGVMFEPVKDQEKDIDSFLKSLIAGEDEGGGWSGNGGGNKDQSNNVWFIGNDEEINYCVRRSDDYPLSNDELYKTIEESLSEWKAFFARYELDDKYFRIKNKRLRENQFQFPDKVSRKMNFNFKLSESCEGARIQFLFGLENGVVTRFKEFSDNHPYGLAIRQSYDHEKYQHSGIVWIDHISSDSLEVKHVVLHELGHVFGMKHGTVPVMLEDLSMFVGKDKRFTSDFLGKIETDVWKYQMIQNEPILLTSMRGRRKLIRRRHRDSGEQRPRRGRAGFEGKDKTQCSDVTYNSSKKLPGEVREALELNENDCHRVSINYVGDKKRRFRPSRILEITLEELNSKKKVIFKGYFKTTKSRVQLPIGPRVVTRLEKQNKPGVFRIKELVLDGKAHLFPLTGAFKKGEKVLPAKIDLHRGLFVEIFIPELGNWWTFKSHFNQD